MRLKASTLASRWVTLLLVGVAPAVARAQQPAPATPPLVFEGVAVVDVEQGRVVPSQRVVIVGNHIQAVGRRAAAKLPKGARVVDARGKYLIPGLWDMHIHRDVYDHRTRATEIADLLLIANGVTGIRDAGSPVPLDTLRRWRQDILANQRIGSPRQVLSGPFVHGKCPRWPICASLRPDSVSADDTIALGKAARRLLDSLQAAGFDMLKLRDVSRQEYTAAAAEARRRGIPFGGHVGHGNDLSVIEASDMGASIIDHLDAPAIDSLCGGAEAGASVERCRPVAERLRCNETWVVPTHISHVDGEVLPGWMPHPDGQHPEWVKPSLPLYERLALHSDRFWAGATPSGNWLRDSTGVGGTKRAGERTGATTLGRLSIAQRVGLPILAGTDAEVGMKGRGVPPFPKASFGFVLHAELAMYVAEGLTTLNALQSATLNPAKFLHATDSLGTVAPGKLADLVLLDEDPLADVTNTTMIRAVVANGRYFDRAALDQLLAEASAKTQAAETAEAANEP